MKPTRTLHELGQSLWLDNITREMLNSGTLGRYIDELSVTGLTSNPTIFDHAISKSATYDADIAAKADARAASEEARRLRFENGELGLDIYDMRQKLKDMGLTYVSQADYLK